MELWLILMLAGAGAVLLAYAYGGGGFAVTAMTGGAVAFWVGVLMLAF